MNILKKNIKPNQTRHAIFLGLGIFVCIYAVLIFYWISHTRYLGFYPFPGEDGILNVIAVDPDSPAERMGLQPGDQLLEVNGLDYRNPVNWYVVVWNLKVDDGDGKNPVNWIKAIWEAKNRLVYRITYKRGTSIMTGKLVTAPPVFSHATFLGLVLCFFTLVLSLLVYLKRPFDPSARIFYLAGCCGGLTYSVIFNLFVISVTPIGVVAGLAIFCLPLLLHFSLIFPERKKVVCQHPAILYIIYLPVLIYICVFWTLIFDTISPMLLRGQTGPVPGIANQTILLAKSLMALILLYVTTTFGCVAHTFFTAENPETKKQIMWLFWGGAISLTLGYIGSLSFFFEDRSLILLSSGGRSLPFSGIIAVVLILFAMALSILKYKLMDVEVIIHRSFAYILVSGVLLLLYFLIFGGLSWFFGMVSGKTTFAVYAVSALIVSFIFRPLLTQVEQRLDKLFFHEKFKFHKAVEALIQALSAVRDTKEIFQKVFHTVAQTIHVQTGALWVVDESGENLKKVYIMPDELTDRAGESDPVIAITHPLVVNLKTLKKGLTHYQVRTEKMRENERNDSIHLFQESRMEIFLPLIFENSLLGMIGLGEKRSGDLYSSDDVGLLSILAHEAAVAMENARAYHQIKALNTENEQKVHHIEQQRNEILVLQKQLLNENIYLREELRQQCNFEEIIGSSPQMRRVFDMVEKVAPTPSTVLIRGESGTGKELIARAIHSNSPRQDKTFVKVNCAAIPANLLESELFGHEKGAFTGAVKQKQGKFEMAVGGTIFLDEIGELAPDLQVKILRVLQEKEFERVGGNDIIKADVRIISATNRDIESAISQNKFREDLFYRLNVITITMPPLRNRNGDIRELTIHFIKKFSRQLNKPIRNIDPDAMKILKTYTWPGNVRELANIIERAMVLGEGDTLSSQDLPRNLVSFIPIPESPGKDSNFNQEMKQIEYQRITQALEQANGNKSEAARMLGMKRTTLNSKLQKLKSLS